MLALDSDCAEHRAIFCRSGHPGGLVILFDIEIAHAERRTASVRRPMPSRSILLCCSVLVLFTSVLHAQSARLSLRAASVQPVEGWHTMRVEHCQGERCIV